MAASPVAVTGGSGNLFLDTLTDESATFIFPFLEKVDAPQAMVVGTSGVHLRHAFFPTGSVISSVARMQDGTEVEVAFTGRGGFYGAYIALGQEYPAIEAMVQIPASMWRLPLEKLRLALETNRPFRERVLRYLSLTIQEISQFAACNRLHPTVERCARWLLMAHDLVAGDEVKLTHDYLATMLGVRRAGVTIAAGVLENAGAIELGRGLICIRNRPELQTMTCECYEVANSAMQRMLGYSVRKN